MKCLSAQPWWLVRLYLALKSDFHKEYFLIYCPYYKEKGELLSSSGPFHEDPLVHYLILDTEEGVVLFSWNAIPRPSDFGMLFWMLSVSKKFQRRDFDLIIGNHEIQDPH